MATIISKFFHYASNSKTVSDFVVLGINDDDIPYVRYKFSPMKHTSLIPFEYSDYNSAFAIARDNYNRKVMFLLTQI